MLNVYTCTTFDGVQPTGCAAVMVAPSRVAAKKLLYAALKDMGLPATVDDRPLRASDINLLHKHTSTLSKVVVLNDGDY